MKIVKICKTVCRKNCIVLGEKVREKCEKRAPTLGAICFALHITAAGHYYLMYTYRFSCPTTLP